MSNSLRRTAAAILVCTAIAGCLGIAVARQTPGTNETACLSNLKQMSLALTMYTQDYDERLPPMQSMAGTQKCIEPYIRNRQVFNCPATTKPYKINTALSGKLLAVIAEPSKAVTFYDALPHQDTQFSVAYLDGHVKREAKAPNLAVKFVAKKAHAASKKPRSRR